VCLQCIIFKGSSFAKIDLISCRNVLIYLEPFTKKKKETFTIFHYALNEKRIFVAQEIRAPAAATEYFSSVWNKG